jgi:hypothetical protein
VTEVPSEYNHPTAIVELDSSGYANNLRFTGTTRGEEIPFEEPEVVLSTIKDDDPFADTKHTLMLDLDVPAMLVPSSTPGHSHLYIDVPMDWDRVVDIMDALVAAGVVEEGYANASKKRRCTALRLPGKTKQDTPLFGQGKFDEPIFESPEAVVF